MTFFLNFLYFLIKNFVLANLQLYSQNLPIVPLRHGPDTVYFTNKSVLKKRYSKNIQSMYQTTADQTFHPVLLMDFPV